MRAPASPVRLQISPQCLPDFLLCDSRWASLRSVMVVPFLKHDPVLPRLESRRIHPGEPEAAPRHGNVFAAERRFYAAAETAPFSKTVSPVFEEARCRNCHNPGGVASATRLAVSGAGRASRWRGTGRLAWKPGCRITSPNRCYRHGSQPSRARQQAVRQSPEIPAVQT
jgi:hypothetical protein